MNEAVGGPPRPALAGAILARAHIFVRERAVARYWADVRAWSLADDGVVPEWPRYETGLWEELVIVCEGLGELAAMDPELLFPPTDPWADEYWPGP